MQSAHDQVIEKARDVVASYAASRGHSNPWSSLSTLLQQMQREYEDRFLYELAQNAYDAHPSDADGEIAILLAEDEAEHGVLYVANRGNPFPRENFDAICELAQSNKTPDDTEDAPSLTTIADAQGNAHVPLFTSIPRLEAFCGTGTPRVRLTLKNIPDGFGGIPIVLNPGSGVELAFDPSAVRELGA